MKVDSRSNWSVSISFQAFADTPTPCEPKKSPQPVFVLRKKVPLGFSFPTALLGFIVAALGRAALAGDGPQELERLIRDLESDNASSKAAAIRELTRIGPKAVAATPKLLPLLHDREANTAELALSALEHFGERAIPLTLKACASANEDERSAGILALGRLRLLSARDASECEAAISSALKSDSKKIKLAAIAAASLRPPRLRSAIPRLLDFLGSDDPDLMGSAIVALGRFGADASPAKAPLLEILQNPKSPSVCRSAAIRSLTSIADSDDKVYKAIGQCLIDANNDAMVRKSAAGALGTANAEKVPEHFLTEVLKRMQNGNEPFDRYLSQVCLRSLSQIKPSVRALPVLLAAAKDGRQSAGAASVAIIAIGQIGREAKEAAPFLLSQITTTNESAGAAIQSYLKIMPSGDAVKALRVISASLPSDGLSLRLKRQIDDAIIAVRDEATGRP